jgi:hypothetical protein
MNASFRHPSADRLEGTARLSDADAPHGPAASLADQACCCVARAVVRVVMRGASSMTRRSTTSTSS